MDNKYENKFKAFSGQVLNLDSKLGSRSALVTRTGSDFLPRFSNCHLEFGKIGGGGAGGAGAGFMITKAL